MNDISSVPRLAPAGWLEALARGERQAADGRTVPAEVVREMLEASIDRIVARRTVPEAGDNTAAMIEVVQEAVKT